MHGIGHRAEGDQSRPEVHDHDRAAVRMPEFQQPVVEVPAVGGEGRLALPRTPDDGQDQVRHRDRDDRQRQDQRDVGGEHRVRRVALTAREQGQGVRVHLPGEGDGGGGQHQADEHRAGVAHEDPGGVHVVRQEAQAHAHQDRGEEGRGRGRLDAVAEPDPVRVEEQRGGGDADHAGGQAVQAVDEVHGVDGDDDERDGEQVALPLGERDRADARDGDPQDGQTLHDHHAGGDHLRAELDQGVELELVVEDADQPDQRRPGEQRPRFVRQLEDAVEVPQVVRDQQARAQTAEHGDAAQSRCGLAVHVAGTDLRHGPGRDRELPHGPGQQVGHRDRDAKRQQIFTHGLPQMYRRPSQPHTLAAMSPPPRTRGGRIPVPVRPACPAYSP